MSFQWQPVRGAFLPATLESDGLMPQFESQAEAEEWLGLNFDALRADGVDEVELRENNSVVYGPMSLEP